MFKKIAFACTVAMMLTCGLVAADEPAGSDGNNNWEFLQLGFWQGLPTNQNTAEVYGLRAGLPFSGGTAPVMGAEISFISAASDSVTGLQFGVLANVSKQLRGLGISCVNVSEEVNGVQIGVVNYSEKKGIQFGLINIIKDGWLPFTLLVNVKF